MSKKSIQEIKRSQTNFFRLILTAIFLSIGTNLFITGFLILNQWQFSYILTIIGVIIIFTTVFIVTLLDFLNTRINETIKGVIVYDKTNKSLVDIPGYSISYRMLKCLKSACVENKNLESIWLKESIGFNPKTHKTTKSTDLLRQILEYEILNRLSIVTTDFYNSSDVADKEVRQWTKNDIPSFVANNDFLNIFSKDMSERAAFNNRNDEDFSNIVSSFSKNGEMYERIEFTLPKKCSLLREKNQIVIKHPLFKIDINPSISGFNTLVPNGFMKYYLSKNIKDFSVLPYAFEVQIKVNYSFKAFFVHKSEYYGWIDKLVSDISEEMHFKDFIDKIQWDSLNALILSIKNNTSKETDN